MTTYLQDKEGKFIPASQRPDGTWRKARRVKDGYVPQEEVPLYESKGKLFGKKPALPKLPVGMCPLMAQEAKDIRLKQQTKLLNAGTKTENINRIPGLLITKQPTAEKSKQNKTSKIADTKPKTLQPKEEVIKHVTDSVSDINLDNQQELAKKLKKLKKKIRETEAIELKIKNKEIKNPSKEEICKVSKKAELMKKLKDLEEQ